METYIALCFLMFVAIGAGQDPTVSIIDKTSRFLRTGAQDIVLQCEINQGIAFLVNHKVEWIRASMVDGNVQETVISAGAQVQQGHPNFYDVQWEVMDKDGPPHILLSLTIKRTRDEDDGFYMCRASPGDGDNFPIASDRVNITIVRDLEYVTMVFKGKHYKSGDESSLPVELDLGTYPVTCTAAGSNPATEDVTLQIGSRPIEIANKDIKQMSSPFTKYETTVTAEVEIGHGDSGHSLSCTAAPNTQGSMTMSANVEVDVNVYDPVITCLKALATKDQRYPKLTCFVDHSDVEVKEYMFEIEDTAEVIREGQTHDDHILLSTQAVNDTHTVVVLDLYKTKKWHFDSNYYLVVVTSDDRITRAPVNLHRYPKVDGNKASVLAPSALCVAAVIFILLRRG